MRQRICFIMRRHKINMLLLLSCSYVSARFPTTTTSMRCLLLNCGMFDKKIIKLRKNKFNLKKNLKLLFKYFIRYTILSKSEREPDVVLKMKRNSKLKQFNRLFVTLNLYRRHLYLRGA